MSESDLQRDGNATEAPTPRRREQALAQGQVLHSAELATSIQLLLGWVCLVWWGSNFLEVLRQLWVSTSRQLKLRLWSEELTVQAAQSLAWDLASVWLIPALIIIATSICYVLLERGGYVSLKPVEWKWERLLPQNGLGKLFSKESVIRSLWIVAKLTGALLIGVGCLWIWKDQISTTGSGTIHSLLTLSWDYSLKLLLILSGASLLVGLGDLLTQWRLHENRLMMTREEVKQEMKDDQGDPHFRAFVRRRQREQNRQRSIKDVPQATLVITNPTHIAIAIKYQIGSPGAPRVLAKGTGDLAMRIKDIARQNQIYMVENKPLARSLYRSVEIGQEIPVEFYRAIAEILARLYQQRPV